MNVMQLKAFVEQHNPWKCYAYGTVAQNLGQNVFSTPEMTTVLFDPSGMVTTGVGGYVTIPVDGIYHVGASGSIASTADGTRLVVAIFKNGVEFKRGADWCAGGVNPLTAAVHTIAYLKAGDQITMQQFTATAGMTTVAAAPYLFVSVAYLCAA